MTTPLRSSPVLIIAGGAPVARGGGGHGLPARGLDGYRPMLPEGPSRTTARSVHQLPARPRTVLPHRVVDAGVDGHAHERDVEPPVGADARRRVERVLRDHLGPVPDAVPERREED